MYTAKKNYRHEQRPKIGVLLTNLGTPDAPTPKALRRYLKEFLSDPRVVEVNRLLWWFILNGVILNIRPRRSAKAYQKVWTDEGSPLLSISKQQRDAIAQAFESVPVHIALGMRYGNPSIPDALDQLREQQVEKLLVLPLYPQYCASTGGSTMDAVGAVLKQWRWVPELHFINHYCDHTAYIQACVSQIQQHWQAHPEFDRLIFSFHGVPKRYLINGDPYHCQCHKTARLIAQSLGLDDHQWQVCFQSRFGREPWLQPYLDKTLEQLPKENVRSVQVFCPGFSADCLETIEEVDMENRALFLGAGGEQFSYISALNASEQHVHALEQLINGHISGWLANLPNAEDKQAQAERARALEQSLG